MFAGLAKPRLDADSGAIFRTRWSCFKSHCHTLARNFESIKQILKLVRIAL